jgi:hypothetical protein
MTDKKPYSSPQLYEVPLDQEQAILTACSLTTMSIAAGVGANGCRASGICEPPGSAGGCKRSNVALVSMGVTCHDMGIRAS